MSYIIITLLFLQNINFIRHGCFFYSNDIIYMQPDQSNESWECYTIIVFKSRCFCLIVSVYWLKEGNAAFVGVWQLLTPPSPQGGGRNGPLSVALDLLKYQSSSPNFIEHCEHQYHTLWQKCFRKNIFAGTAVTSMVSKFQGNVLDNKGTRLNELQHCYLRFQTKIVEPRKSRTKF